jgi:hypothetical protein
MKSVTLQVIYELGNTTFVFQDDKGEGQDWESAMDKALAFINSPNPVEKSPGTFYPRSRVILYKVTEDT